MLKREHNLKCTDERMTSLSSAKAAHELYFGVMGALPEESDTSVAWRKFETGDKLFGLHCAEVEYERMSRPEYFCLWIFHEKDITPTPDSPECLGTD